MHTRAQQLLEIKQNSALGTFKMLEAVERDAKRIAKEMVREEMSQMRSEFDTFKRELANTSDPVNAGFIEKISKKAVADLIGKAKGDKGEEGDKGIQGEIGLTGSQGLQGDIGLTGQKGDSGLMGKMGMRGKTGDDGKKGIMGDRGDKGPDGRSIKPLEIWNKIVSLKELKDFIIQIAQGVAKREAARGGGGGGGGMGNPLHESFSTTSATTTVTVANGIAANGNAIWVYYEGQFLVKDTHYTISGRVLTFTFTLDDDSNIDVTYIRT